MTNSIEDKFYAGGYDDGIRDAESVVIHADSLDGARVAILRLRGFTDCPRCNGSGENTEPTRQDALLAMVVVVAGARVHPSPLCCRECGGLTVIPPAKKAAAS